MQRNSVSAPTDKVERDFLDALERLVRGEPRDVDLLHRYRGGKMKIGFVTVAKEAGHSRTLIGMDGCAYPRVRAKILAIKAPTGRVGNLTAADVIASLRGQLAQLRKERAKLATQLADSVNRVRRLERDMNRRTRQQARRDDRGGISPNKIVGTAPLGSEVIRLVEKD